MCFCGRLWKSPTLESTLDDDLKPSLVKVL